jgi:hypothetical protein
VKRLVVTVCVLAGCIPDFKSPGTLPGEAQGVFESQTSAFTSKTVHNADGSANERTGVLETMRYTLGTYWGMSRFGVMSGIEMSIAMGWLTGAAEGLEDDAMEKNHFYFDNEYGGVLQPLSLPLGKAAILRLAGDFGVGYTRDDRYPYAGARLGFGPTSRSWAFDASARRRFGDVPGNESAHEDHARATVSFRPGKKRQMIVHLGFEYVSGDQRTIISGGVEQGRNDYLFRGRYEMMSFVLGLGAAEAPENVRLEK